MKNLSIWGVFLLVCAVCLWTVGDSLFSGFEERTLFQSVVEERLEHAASGRGPVFVGAAGNWGVDREMLDGIELAAEEINRNGGLLGRELKIIPADDKGGVDGALRVAQGFCNDERVGLVIGHENPALSAMTVQNYEFYKLLLMSPVGSNPDRSGQGFPLSFGNGLPPEQFAEGAVSFAVSRGWKNVGLLYSDAEYGSRLARRFESAGDSHDVLCMTGIIPPLTGEGREELREWLRGLAIEVVVLSASPREERWVASVCREAGDVPVLLANSSENVVSGSSTASERLFVLRRPGHGDSQVQAFSVAFEKKCQRKPGYRASAGYDALMLVAQAVAQAESLISENVAASLKELEKPGSVTGTKGFDENGNAVKEDLRFVPVGGNGS